ncbi:hypothetical protein B0T18DRAFT_68282 [Schizothecium vesticola]|uniref:Uncharacterized protein n=1 Tax=Schizothecium vesticola TaxID=314040 RepID=A0AA40KA90_9PEZI|nr:hypothetical protein B0T18DRAFT_68282 [Schizothecium vesticola]
MDAGISESGLIASAFGKDVQDVGTIVQTFDFSKTAGNLNDFLQCDLAPSFGSLNKTTIKELDDELKVMIAATLKQLAKVQERSWQDVLATMSQNALMEPEGAQVARADKLVKEGTNEFKSDGTSQAGIVREVHTWFTNLIKDEDVMMSTKFDIEVLGKIVALTGATIDNLRSLFARDDYYERAVVDIAVLRFPDVEQPYFKLYRIKLTAWLDSTRILFHQVDKSGINGEYHCRKFKPRESVIKALSGENFRKAVATAEDMFE